jgi:N-acetylglucosaminyldiphosphoundecaprenol N-acetyl-beta-D-mannosaminyltransferase
LPDGKPLQIVGKLKGHKEIARLFGPTVMENFIDWGRNDGLSHFFFGSSDETLTRLKAAIELQYPGTNIAGMLAPPFRPYTEWQNDVFIQLINNARPDVIWVGLGAPKQERWMYEHHKQIQCGMMFGIGAGFDYLAGNTRHAPAWMKNTSLEWLFRLVQEPGRLWKRYLSTIPHFVFFAGLELLGIRTKSSN